MLVKLHATKWIILVLLFAILIGCSQQTELAKGKNGLPAADELMRKSSEQFDLVHRFETNGKLTFREYADSTRPEDAPWEDVASLEQYNKVPFLWYMEQIYADREYRLYATEPYGVLFYMGSGYWEQLGKKDDEYTVNDVNSRKESLNPYRAAPHMEDLNLTVDQEEDSYTLTISGTLREEPQQDDLEDSTILNIPRLTTLKQTFTIDKKTLLPVRLDEEFKEQLDFSGDITHVEGTNTTTYQYNQLDEQALMSTIEEILQTKLIQ